MAENQKPKQPGGTSSRRGRFLMQPMTTFNPDKLCIVHDKLNNVQIEWKQKWATDYRRYAQPYDTSSVIAWDGLLLDGWQPRDSA
jgi:hypothetical protein